MKIKIVYDARERLTDLRNGGKIKVALTYKKRYFQAAFVFIIGILSLFIGWDDNDFLFVGLGSTFIIFFCFFLYRLIRDRSKAIIKDDAALKKLAEKIGLITATFSDDLFTFRDNEQYYEFKWVNFSSYLVYEDYLFLIMNNKIMSSFGMHINVFKPEELSEIVNFLKSKLPLYKNNIDKR
jgi:hypothetical protein